MISSVFNFRKFADLLYRCLHSVIKVFKGVKSSTERNSRHNNMQKITENIKLYTEKPQDVDPETLSLAFPIDKPLVIILNWLLAKHKHLSKFVELYSEKGYDVVTVAITPCKLLWPKTGSQIISADLIKFLENNPKYNPLLLHGFSGGYVWGECLVHMARDQERYISILNRISGQIWDSAADITEIPVGMIAQVNNNHFTMGNVFNLNILENALRRYIIYHMKTFHNAATKHYILSGQTFHSTLVKSPALFLLSKSDPVGSFASNQRVREKWESQGISCTWKCCDKSPHVGHFQKQKEEYISALFDHLRSTNVIGFSDKVI